MFHERYRELIGSNPYSDSFCGYIDHYKCKKLVDIMVRFKEPIVLHPDRYKPTYHKETNAFLVACNTFNEIMSSDFYTCINYSEYGSVNEAVSFLRIAYIFSIIELQFDLLSEGERSDFSKELNAFFNQYNIRFRIIDGKITKIDSFTAIGYNIKETALVNAGNI